MLLKVIDVTEFLKINTGYSVYPNEFPRGEINSVVALINGGGVTDRNKSTPNVQFIVRAKHPSEAEIMAYTIFELLNNKTNFKVGDKQIVLSQSLQAVPLYMGKENDTYSYSTNFKWTIGGKQID